MGRRRSYPDPAGPRPAGCSPSAGEETKRDSDEVEAATTMNPCFCFCFFVLNQAQIVKTTGRNLEQENQLFNYSIINQLWKQSRTNKQVIQSLFWAKNSFLPFSRRYWGIIKREGWSEIGEEEEKIAFKEKTNPMPPSNCRSMEHMRFNVVPIGGNEK